MRILDMGINWNYGLGNDPILCLQVDRIFDRTEFTYGHKNGLWYGIRESQVSFFSWKGPDNEGGYYREEFNIQTEAGKTVTLKGPWSSRSGVMNNVFDEPCIEVMLTVDPVTFANGNAFPTGVFYSGAITVKRATICLLGLGAHLIRICLPNEKFYRIVDDNSLGKRKRPAIREVRLVIADYTGKTGWKVNYKDDAGRLLCSPGYTFKDVSMDDLKVMLERYERCQCLEIKAEWWES